MEVSDDRSAVARDSLVTFTVELDPEVEAGDHILTLVRVIDLHRDDERHPLIFFGSDTRKLATSAPGLEER